MTNFYWFLFRSTTNITFLLTNNYSPHQEFVKKLCGSCIFMKERGEYQYDWAVSSLLFQLLNPKMLHYALTMRESRSMNTCQQMKSTGWAIRSLLVGDFLICLSLSQKVYWKCAHFLIWAKCLFIPFLVNYLSFFFFMV